jgi:hypothetical protein
MGALAGALALSSAPLCAGEARHGDPYVEQIGDYPAILRQRGAGQSISSEHRAAAASGFVAGYGNTARVVQRGRGNEVNVMQHGDQNDVSAYQSGTGNRADIDQYGVGHKADVRQKGHGLSVGIEQFGVGSGAPVVVRQH